MILLPTPSPSKKVKANVHHEFGGTMLISFQFREKYV